MATQAGGSRDVDVIVVGGGIAGASVAYWLASDARVAVLERESTPDHHSTGRSAAVYFLSYGNEQVRRLTAAGRSFFDQPPDGFAEHPLLHPRGALMVAEHGQLAALEQYVESIRATEPGAELIGPDEACRRVPVLRPDRVEGAMYSPELFDIDVHALHQGFLRGVRRAGGELVTGSPVTAIERLGDRWHVETPTGTWTCDTLVNAAGAWADVVGAMAGAPPIGLVPKRRSAFVFEPPAGFDTSGWPLAIGVAEDWYFKPEAGVLLGSPANADPVEPHDVRPEELDIALAIERIEERTTMTIRRPLRTWAGLRSFVADGGLVGGPDPHVPGFVWVAAQGGYGIQTAPAMGEACAALALGRAIPEHLAAHGVTAEALGPGRLHRAGPTRRDRGGGS